MIRTLIFALTIALISISAKNGFYIGIIPSFILFLFAGKISDLITGTKSETGLSWKSLIIISLIVFVGGFFLIHTFLPDEPIIDEPIVSVPKPAEFAFKENLQTAINQIVAFEIKLNNDKIKTLNLVFNDSILKTWDSPKGKLSYEFLGTKVGAGKIELISTLSDGKTISDTRMLRLLSDIVPEHLVAKILKSYPHNVESFTQGLEFYNGSLYEGTGDPGQKGKTLITEVYLTSGEHNENKSMGLDATHFGEGITILNDVIYQLTWKNQKCLTYDLGENITPKSQFFYTGEGWGLCNDGASLIMSNGTERLSFRNPETFAIERVIEVYSDLGPVTNLNELEYINGKIYANVWTTKGVIVIDPLTGKVLEEIDATELVKKGRGMYGEVLNGIAFNAETGKTYMTGKNWFQLYEVKFEKL